MEGRRGAGRTARAEDHSRTREIMGHRTTAFTLVELLIVIVVLAILSAISAKRFSSALDDARQASSETDEAALQRIVNFTSFSTTAGDRTWTAGACPTTR
jgi:prepilin-type N-terminal cleavage/methylation domain-containing protein